MARVGKETLISLAVDSMRSSGWIVERLSAYGSHPADLQTWSPDGVHRLLRIYIWNVTHGGGAARAASEYRIQVTGVESFQSPPGSDVLILGWYAELGVFAAYDFLFHRGALGASPSIQIGRSALETAAENGLSPYTRGNGELAIAVRWDLLPAYIARMGDLHSLGASDAAFHALLEISADPDIPRDAAIDNVPSAHRRSVLVTTARLLRDAGFRDRVMTAYGHSCAFCGVQLELLDAAHILPVNHEASTDHVTNGVALCALHHRSYDRSLVTFDSDYRIVVSEARVAKLRVRERAGGERDFREALHARVILPASRRNWPDPDLINLANELRGW